MFLYRFALSVTMTQVTSFPISVRPYVWNGATGIHPYASDLRRIGTMIIAKVCAYCIDGYFYFLSRGRLVYGVVTPSFSVAM